MLDRDHRHLIAATEIEKMADDPDPQMTRHEFTIATATAAGALAVAAARAAQAATPPAHGPAAHVTVNGTPHVAEVDVRTSVLDYLRETLGLTGTKKGCDHGQCGACTVHINGRRVNSCLQLIAMHDGDAITTVEGLADGNRLHPVQAAFLAHDGFQCGYCTPGQIMSAVALLHEPIGPADSDVAEAMSGNICRCGAYNNIVAAVQTARKGT